MIRAVLACLLLVGLSACQTNPYAQFYKSHLQLYANEPDAPQPVLHSGGEPQLVAASGDLKQEPARMFADGYGLVGETNFNGPLIPTQQALAQAKAVGASRVIISQAAGATAATSSQRAAFFAPLQRRGTGVYFENIPDAMRQEVGTNSGIRVVTIRRESPAFRADILPNDVILAVDNRQIRDRNDLRGFNDIFAGKPVELTIWRKGQTIKKTITVPAGEWPAS